MKKQSNLEVFLRFLRSALLIDVGVAVIVGIICFAIDLVTLEAFGTFLTWAGVVMIFVACILGIGRFFSRATDAADFSVTGSGNMTDNLRQIAASSNSSLVFFFLLVVAAVGLLGIGSLLQAIAVLP